MLAHLSPQVQVPGKVFQQAGRSFHKGYMFHLGKCDTVFYFFIGTRGSGCHLKTNATQGKFFAKTVLCGNSAGSIALVVVSPLGFPRCRALKGRSKGRWKLS